MEQHSPLLSAFEKARPHLERLLPEETKRFFALVEEKRRDSKPVITVYGIYSHGKSSLINALLGEDAADIGPDPTTDKPQAYEWRGYTLVDTPGIDAPIEHEQITNEQLYKSEVVLLVINSRSNELLRIQELLVAAAKNRQHVCLIINDWSGCLNEPEKLVRLKDNFAKKLQEEAAKQEVENILDLVPIFFVNAKSALKAKKEHNDKLLEHSGIIRLEQDIIELFFEKLPAGQLWLRLLKEFSNLVDSGQTAIAEQTNEPRLSKAQKSQRRILQTEKEAREDIERELDRRLARLKIQIRNRLDPVRSQEEAVDAIAPLIQGFGDSLGAYCQSRLEEAGSTVEGICLDYDDFLRSLDAKNFEPTAAGGDSGVLAAVKSLPWKNLLGELKWENLVKDTVVNILKFAKEQLPQLFRGIGIKTMGKWAEAFLKALGPILMIASLIYDFYQASKSEEEARDAALRKAQQLDEAAASLVEQIRQTVSQQLAEVMKRLFAPLKEKIQAEVEKLLTSQEEARRSLARLGAIQADIRRLFETKTGM